MSAKEKIAKLFRSGVSLSVAGTILGTGGYVLYTDLMRYPRMINTYKTGNILPPFRENQFEIKYCQRKEEERILREILDSKFTNEYYFINGEVGSGKTRTLVEMSRRFKETRGAKNEGSPIYVSVGQGKSFPDTLANAVNFLFDEHISFRFFLDFVVKIHSFPARDDQHKLTRVLDAIEKSAFMYMQKSGKPVVLILDGVNYLSDHMPGALRKLQDKAKLWADTNTVKVIFVSNEDRTELMLQEHHSNWSRADTPIAIGDLSQEESITFLTTPGLYEYQVETDNATLPRMDADQARAVYDQVGGRMHYLIAYKRDWLEGIPLGCTTRRLREKEREKFLQVSHCPSMWKVVEALEKAPDRTMLLTKLVQETDASDVMKLVDAHVIKVERHNSGVRVKFESVLTEKVISDMYGKPVSLASLRKVPGGSSPASSPGSMDYPDSAAYTKSDLWTRRDRVSPVIKGAVASKKFG